VAHSVYCNYLWFCSIVCCLLKYSYVEYFENSINSPAEYVLYKYAITIINDSISVLFFYYVCACVSREHFSIRVDILVLFFYISSDFIKKDLLLHSFVLYDFISIVL